MALPPSAAVYSGIGGMSPSAGAIYGATKDAAGYYGIDPNKVTGSQINSVMNAYRNAYSGSNRSSPRPSAPTGPSGGSRSGGSRYSYGRGGGGGGGGGTPAPKMTQGLLDWAAQLLSSGHPQNIVANNLDLPDYAGMAVRAFDPTGFNQMQQQWNQAAQSDRNAANLAYSQLNDYFRTHNQNAFKTNRPTWNGPGESQAEMGRMIQSQGLDPSLNAAAVEGRQAGNAAFQNLWKVLGANEQIAQQDRRTRAQIDQGNTMRMLDLARQSGNMQLNQARGQAQTEWQRRADERAYQDYQMQQQLLQQEAMQNWQRANQVQDTNATNRNSYNNAVLEAMLGLMPQLIASPGLNLPTGSQMGLY